MSIDINLYGTIPNKLFSNFQTVMIGLSGTIGTKYCTQEVCFRPKYETPFGPSRNDDIALSLVSNVFSENNILIEWKDRKWELVQRNQPEPPKLAQKIANHRIVHRTAVEGDAIQFLQELGYKFVYEFVIRGFEFWLASKIQVLCYRVYKVEKKYNVASAVHYGNSDSWIIQAQIPNCSPDQLLSNSQLLFKLATQLSGLVSLSVLDHTLFQAKFQYLH